MSVESTGRATAAQTRFTSKSITTIVALALLTLAALVTVKCAYSLGTKGSIFFNVGLYGGGAVAAISAVSLAIFVYLRGKS
ncbi:MAG: hypothetical protein S4CHLAM81_02320 [Chlamydiales bacterium]|nr:hypothetical protein [Chlamydiales bacterium]MCH9635024.1 hypothetical protein [Chlamydiales bacterium]MCH9704442.1 hypothetical protein [Chlamydiota bacterium]